MLCQREEEVEQLPKARIVDSYKLFLIEFFLSSFHQITFFICILCIFNKISAIYSLLFSI